MKVKNAVLSSCLVIFLIVGVFTFVGGHQELFDKLIPPTTVKVQEANSQVIAGICKNSTRKHNLLAFLNSHHIGYDDIIFSELPKGDALLQEAISEGFPKGTTSIVAIWIRDLAITAPVGKLAMLDLRFFFEKSGRRLEMRSKRYTRDKEQRIRP